MAKEVKTVKHEERAHALLSASGASKWLNCTASARLEEDFEQVDSPYAREGTLAHELAELTLKNRLGLIDASEAIKRAAEIEADKFYSEEMPSEVDKYVDYVLEQYNVAKFNHEGTMLLIEEKVDLTNFIEDGFGTNDAIVLADGILEVIDLKYGKGVRVSAVDNSQLKLYGLGSLYKHMLSYDIHTIRLTISQPRLDTISSWEISAEELLEWGEGYVTQQAKEAYAGTGEQKPGDWCKFCKAKPRCRALSEQNLEIAKHEFKDPNLLEDSEMVAIYQLSGQIKDWLNGIDTFMLSEALKGREWPDLKVVHGRSSRKFIDLDDVKQYLILKGFKDEQILESKLKSLTALEKVLGKKNFEIELGDFITKPPGAPTLVTKEDGRPAYGFTEAANDFSDNEDELL